MGDFDEDYGKITEAFKNMKKLRLLHVTGDLDLEGPIYLPQVRWLTWKSYRKQYLPTIYGAQKLVGLELCHSDIVQLWEGSKVQL